MNVPSASLSSCVGSEAPTARFFPRVFFRYRELVIPLQLTAGLCVGLALVEERVRHNSKKSVRSWRDP